MSNLKTWKKDELIKEVERLRPFARTDAPRLLAELTEARLKRYAAEKEVNALREALAETGEARIEVLLDQLDDANGEIKRLEGESKYKDQQLDWKDEEIGKLETKLDDARNTDNKALDLADHFRALRVLSARLLPGYESPDESLDIYDFRRALEDAEVAMLTVERALS